jgi:hypothetical protein
MTSRPLPPKSRSGPLRVKTRSSPRPGVDGIGASGGEIDVVVPRAAVDDESQVDRDPVVVGRSNHALRATDDPVVTVTDDPVSVVLDGAGSVFEMQHVEASDHEPVITGTSD